MTDMDLSTLPFSLLFLLPARFLKRVLLRCPIWTTYCDTVLPTIVWKLCQRYGLFIAISLSTSVET